MELSPDLNELLALFHAHRVEFVIVGAHALAFHGAPRFTGDLDILVEPEETNAVRIVAALVEFGFGSSGITPDDFIHPDQVIQLGHPPSRVDLLTSLTGVDWDTVSANAIDDSLGTVPVRFIGRRELIRNKRALGRHKDLADLEALGEDPEKDR
ncbi:MAG: hypothetical protein EA427_02935 [Spirochaetaceae bacterium]|nr:MAG: hypothetical protein EA427_02935 [Spirochaetaceae bacterium]